MLRRTLLLASLGGFLSACVVWNAMPPPTPFPPAYLPTVVYLTAQALKGTLAIQTAAVTPTPTPTPTLTFTPAPTSTPTPVPAAPLASIRILAPGPASRIASPLEVRLTVLAGRSRNVEIALLGEDGRVLARLVKPVLGSMLGDSVFVKIPFEIRAVAEAALLQVSTKDERGRIQALNTVRVLLLSSGASQINPPGDAVYEHIVLDNLPPRAAISGGTLVLEGRFLPLSRQPLIFDLLSDDNEVRVSRILAVTGLEWQGFSTTLPYRVKASTPARLFVRQADEALDVPLYVYSQEVILSP